MRTLSGMGMERNRGRMDSRTDSRMGNTEMVRVMDYGKESGRHAVWKMFGYLSVCAKEVRLHLLWCGARGM